MDSEALALTPPTPHRRGKPADAAAESSLRRREAPLPFGASPWARSGALHYGPDGRSGSLPASWRLVAESVDLLAPRLQPHSNRGGHDGESCRSEGPHACPASGPPPVDTCSRWPGHKGQRVLRQTSQLDRCSHSPRRHLSLRGAEGRNALPPLPGVQRHHHTEHLQRTARRIDVQHRASGSNARGRPEVVTRSLPLPWPIHGPITKQTFYELAH